MRRRAASIFRRAALAPSYRALPETLSPVPPSSERRRSVAFLEDGERRWACFLVTTPVARDRWHGHFAFRPSHSERPEDEVHTAEIFVEASEAEIHEKARGLGRPLLRGLLDSAIHTSARRGESPHLRGRFRSLLVADSEEISGPWPDEVPEGAAEEREALRSLYESYRLDQVSHLICLVEPDAFEAAVDTILEGARIDFRATDRVQFARMVVDHIEGLLPLPDFDTWVEDYLAHPDRYRLYAHTLHREGRLP